MNICDWRIASKKKRIAVCMKAEWGNRSYGSRPVLSCELSLLAMADNEPKGITSSDFIARHSMLPSKLNELWLRGRVRSASRRNFSSDIMWLLNCSRIIFRLFRSIDFCQLAMVSVLQMQRLGNPSGNRREEIREL